MPAPASPTPTPAGRPASPGPHGTIDVMVVGTLNRRAAAEKAEAEEDEVQSYWAAVNPVGPVGGYGAGGIAVNPYGPRGGPGYGAVVW